MKDNSLAIILAIAVLYLLRRGQQNDEAWSVQRDENGRLVGIKVHRHIRGE